MNRAERAVEFAEEFEQYRALLFGIAYRMLGSAMEAEDIVQDAYLRFSATPRQTIREPKGFLSTVVTRLSLNRLQSARARHETYIGPWLPEPLPTDCDGWLDVSRASQEESISLAFLVLLQTLTPAERAVFLLREVFDYDYAEIAAIVEKSESASRQLFRRARQRVRDGRPRFPASAESQRQLVERFLQAVTNGDMAALTALLAEDVTFWADGGGVRGAATRPLHGRAAVAAFLLGSVRLVSRKAMTLDMSAVNGEWGVVLRESGEVRVVMTFEGDAALIHNLRFIANPEKLRRFATRPGAAAMTDATSAQP